MKQEYIEFHPGRKYIARPKKGGGYFYTLTLSYYYLSDDGSSGIGADYIFSEDEKEYKGGYFPFSEYIFEYA